MFESLEKITITGTVSEKPKLKTWTNKNAKGEEFTTYSTMVRVYTTHRKPDPAKEGEYKSEFRLYGVFVNGAYAKVLCENPLDKGGIDKGTEVTVHGDFETNLSKIEGVQKEGKDLFYTNLNIHADQKGGFLVGKHFTGQQKSEGSTGGQVQTPAEPAVPQVDF